MPSQKAARNSDDTDSFNAVYKSEAPKKLSLQFDKGVDLGRSYCSTDKKCDSKIQYSYYPTYQVDDRKKWTSKEGHDTLGVFSSPATEEINDGQLRKSMENGFNLIPAHLPQTVSNSHSLPGRKSKSQKKKDYVKKAEDCEDYKGNLPLNEVLSYITGMGTIVEDNHLSVCQDSNSSYRADCDCKGGHSELEKKDHIDVSKILLQVQLTSVNNSKEITNLNYLPPSLQPVIIEILNIHLFQGQLHLKVDSVKNITVLDGSNSNSCSEHRELSRLQSNINLNVRNAKNVAVDNSVIHDSREN